MKKEQETQGLPLAALTRVEMDKKMHARATVNFMMALESWGDENVGPKGVSECLTVWLGDGLWKRRRHFIRPK
jgi:hypothetical protein